MIPNDIKTGGAVHPYFSVIITTYNREKLLKRALDSLLVQTERDWEAIIIDDGSTDNTEALTKQYLHNSNKIKFKKQQRKGYSLAKNAGLPLASGRFITFLDSDDEYDCAHLESRKKILQDNPLAEFLHGGVTIVGNPFVPDMYDYSKQIHLSQCTIGATFFIQKKLFLALKGFRDIPLGSDADFFERVKNAGKPIIKTEIPSYIYYRDTPGSITNTIVPCNPINP